MLRVFYINRDNKEAWKDVKDNITVKEFLKDTYGIKVLHYYDHDMGDPN